MQQTKMCFYNRRDFDLLASTTTQLEYKLFEQLIQNVSPNSLLWMFPEKDSLENGMRLAVFYVKKDGDIYINQIKLIVNSYD